jgi:tetratricopeptide (TPR) repeat protein
VAEPFADLQGALPERYRIRRLVGVGGMANVYLANDAKLNRNVAIKVLKPELASRVFNARFAREIAIAARLHHVNILPLLDAGDVEGLPYYVMPFVEGESLAERLRRERQIPVAEAVRIAGTVAGALAYAHSQGVVHRDIKPGNIMLAGDNVLVADFGIARAMDLASGHSITTSGAAVGTPSYMSPEQASGATTVDHRTDIYSLACVLYEALVGEPPFTGPTVQAILARQAVQAVPPISVVRSSVPPALEHVVTKSLSKVPADRYATALEFRDALAQVDLSDLAPVVRPGQRLAGVLRLAAVLILGWVAWRAFGGSRPTLDDNRIVVYPLLSPTLAGAEQIGEDVATTIGHTLDETGPLRWIDGWSLLSDEARRDIRKMSLADARTIARSQRSGRFLTGRVALQGDSAVVFLDLHDTRGDSTIRGVRASGDSTRPWQAGLRAITALLSTIIPSGSPEVGEPWLAREPRAVASFLLGERQFRRGAFDSALVRYRDAVASDSLFALAAIRGAQSAGWIHESRVARTLVRLAVSRAADLEPRHAALARGYQAFLLGDAEQALSEFTSAVNLDSELAAAWWHIGDAYTHLIPRKGRPDSLAEAALLKAHRLDSTAVYPMFHLLEIAIRKGEQDRTERLWERFVAVRPERTLSDKIRIMRTCVLDGVGSVSWNQEALAEPQELLTAGKSLAAAGSQVECAKAAFSAVLRADTASDAFGVGRRWSALVGLQSLLLSQGRVNEVAKLLDSASTNTASAAALYLMNAAASGQLKEQATLVAQHDAERYGPEYRKAPSSQRLWVLALWEASQGNVNPVSAIADELDQRARANGSRQDRLLADAVAAHAALAAGDTSVALRRLRLLRPTAPPDSMPWSLAEPLGPERLLLAQLLVAKGEPHEALEVAEVFDSQEPLIYALYRPASLVVRQRAAEQLGNRALARRFSSMLESMRK